MTTKREALAALLDGSMVSIVLEPQRAGVAVPEPWASHPLVMLNLSWRLELPATLALDEDAVRARLRFGTEYFDCVVPWPAIVAAHRWADGSEADWREEVRAAVGAPVPVANAPSLSAVASMGERLPIPGVTDGVHGSLQPGFSPPCAPRPPATPVPRLRLVRDDE